MADQTRTAAIQAAVTRQLDLRRGLIDRADDLGEIIITIRLMAGTNIVKATVVSEQHVNRRMHETRA